MCKHIALWVIDWGLTALWTYLNLCSTKSGSKYTTT